MGHARHNDAINISENFRHVVALLRRRSRQQAANIFWLEVAGENWMLTDISQVIGNPINELMPKLAEFFGGHVAAIHTRLTHGSCVRFSVG